MVTLEQIRQLDTRVRRAIELIGKLKEENYTLKNRLAEYQDRIEELEVLISNFKEDQSEIEQGIVNVISELESIDDAAKNAAQAKEPHNDGRAQENRPRDARPLHPQSTPHQVKPAPVQRTATPPVREQPVEEAGSVEADKPEAELDIF